MRRRTFLAAAASAGIAGAAGCLDDETTADGTTGDGDGDGTGSDGSGTEGTPADAAEMEELWSVPVDTWKLRAPAIEDGTVYVAEISPGNVRAYDLETGDERWTMGTGANTEGDADVGDGAVYVATTAGDVYAFELDDGSQRWQTDLGDEARSATAVRDGLVLVEDRGSTVFALDTERGQVEWTFSPGEVVRYVDVHDGLLYVAHDNDGPFAVDLATGEAVWNHDGGVESYPTYGSDHVVYGDFPTDFLAVDAGDGTVAWEVETERGAVGQTIVDDVVVVPETLPDDGQAPMQGLDLEDGSEVWRRSDPDEALPPPTRHDGLLYYGFKDGGLRGIDPATGETRAAHEFDGRVYPPAVADGTMIVSTGEESIVALETP